MTKKLRNRKNIKQNNRNRLINKHYISTIKTLLKKIKKISFTKINPIENKNIYTISTKKLLNLFSSILDKAVKKNVIHKNNAARKKSKIFKYLNLNI